MQQFSVQTIRRKRKHAQLPQNKLQKGLKGKSLGCWALDETTINSFAYFIKMRYSIELDILSLVGFIMMLCVIRLLWQYWVLLTCLVFRSYDSISSLEGSLKAREKHQRRDFFVSQLLLAYICAIEDLISLLLINPGGVYCCGHSPSVWYVISNSTGRDLK